MIKKLSEEELHTSILSYLRGLEIENLDEFIITNIDLEYGSICARKETSNINGNLKLVENIVSSINLIKNSCHVGLRKTLYNKNNNTSSELNTNYNISIDGNKYLESVNITKSENGDVKYKNGHCKKIDVEDGYSILDGYPVEAKKLTKK